MAARRRGICARAQLGSHGRTEPPSLYSMLTLILKPFLFGGRPLARSCARVACRRRRRLLHARCAQSLPRRESLALATLPLRSSCACMYFRLPPAPLGPTGPLRRALFVSQGAHGVVGAQLCYRSRPQAGAPGIAEPCGGGGSPAPGPMAQRCRDPPCSFRSPRATILMASSSHLLGRWYLMGRWRPPAAAVSLSATWQWQQGKQYPKAPLCSSPSC